MLLLFVGHYTVFYKSDSWEEKDKDPNFKFDSKEGFRVWYGVSQ
jgi:hypothetical protein